MSTNRSRRIDRDTAEQLLGGGLVDSEAGQASLTGQAALAGLLAAAKAPAAGPAGGALAGEAEAMAAFRAARHSTAPQHSTEHHRRRTMADTALARAFSAKALAVALAVTTAGGVAFAASTGNLPTVLGGHGPTGPVASDGSHSAQPGGGTGRSGGPGTPSGGAKASASAEPGERTGASPGSASADAGQVPDLAKLCKAVNERTGNTVKLRELLAEDAMQPLVRTAGGPDKVASYCATTVGKGNAATGNPSPGNASPTGDHGKPTATPSPVRTDHPDKSTPPSADQRAVRSSDSGG